MRNLYIGHSYHTKTKSTRWFIEFLTKHSRSLDVAFDESWMGGKGIQINDIENGDYDRIFVFQLDSVVSALARKLKDRLVFIPMYDGSAHLSEAWWKDIKDIPILSFSWTQHSHL